MSLLSKISDYISPYDPQKTVFEFYNCDEHKTYESMNPGYNTEVFKDNRGGRRALWAKIKEQLASKAIELDCIEGNPEGVLEAIRQLVMKGNPEEAQNYIKYAAIIRKDMYC